MKVTPSRLSQILAFAMFAVAAPHAGQAQERPWGVAAELLFLKAYSNEDRYDDQSTEAAYAFGISYRNEDKLGFRGRYFAYEGTAGQGDDFPEMSSFDVEVYDTFQLDHWGGAISVGVRQAEFKEDQGRETDFSGFGPTLALQLSRPVTKRFEIYADARTSFVFGDEDVDREDEFVPIVELEIGVQLNFSAFGGRDAYVRFGLDAQNWASISDDDNEDASLFGGAIEFGVNF